MILTTCEVFVFKYYGEVFENAQILLKFQSADHGVARLTLKFPCFPLAACTDVLVNPLVHLGTLTYRAVFARLFI